MSRLDEEIQKILNEAGYDYNKGMSNNAVQAYNNNEMPKSKWAKTLMIDAFKKQVEELYTGDSYTSKYLSDLYSDVLNDKDKLFRFLNKQDIKKLQELLLDKCSWHHTSKFYNKTDFYRVDVEIALNNINQDEDFENFMINEVLNEDWENRNSRNL